jgi:ADP-ribose pyrophosphatase YjhB (NUDIX family)
LLPVRHEKGLGLLVVKRGIEPGKGKWALVGGFLEEHESWAEGGARELFEETGARVDAATLTPFWYTSSAPRPNRVLLFSAEASTEGHAFAFPLHVEAVRRFFDAQSSKNDPETPIVSGI